MIGAFSSGADAVNREQRTNGSNSADQARTITGIPLAIFILDRLSGENAPLIPGLFERSVASRCDAGMFRL